MNIKTMAITQAKKIYECRMALSLVSHAIQNYEDAVISKRKVDMQFYWDLYRCHIDSFINNLDDENFPISTKISLYNDAWDTCQNIIRRERTNYRGCGLSAYIRRKICLETMKYQERTIKEVTILQDLVKENDIVLNQFYLRTKHFMSVIRHEYANEPYDYPTIDRAYLAIHDIKENAKSYLKGKRIAQGLGEVFGIKGDGTSE